MHPNKSPCFLHSHLGRRASVTDWLKSKEQQLISPELLTTSKSITRQRSPERKPNDCDELEEHLSSLTVQLAETAVCVRDMSKQLGTQHSIFLHILI